MKWLTTILTFYLLALSLWPCADEPLFVAKQTDKAVFTAAAASTPVSSHEHEHDQCTPFCTCTCCAAMLTVVPRFQYSLIASVEIVPTVVAAFNYASAHPLDPITAIWQPPQLRV